MKSRAMVGRAEFVAVAAVVFIAGCGSAASGGFGGGKGGRGGGPGAGGGPGEGPDAAVDAPGVGPATDAGTGPGTGTGTDTGAGSPDSGVTIDSGGTSGALSIEMVSGNGEVLLTEWPNLDPLVVRVTKGGAPVVGELVTWTHDPDVNIGYSVTTNMTDSNGLAQVEVIGGGIMAGLSYIQGKVTATIPTGSVEFWTTTTWNGPSMMQITAAAEVLKPGAAMSIGSGKAGSVLTGAIQVLVNATTGDHTGGGIPYAGVRLSANGDTTMPAPAGLGCVGGTVLTDSTGTATCDVQLGTTPGTYGFSIAVAGFREFPSMTVTITP